MYRPPYTQSISRQNKACFLFLLDQSFSMEEPLGNSSNRKCDELVTAINGWLQNMAIRASGDEGATGVDSRAPACRGAFGLLGRRSVEGDQSG